MKKIATLLVFVFAISVTAQAQRGNRMQRGAKMTAQQRATLAAKRLTLALDLNKAQTEKVTALYTEQAVEREKAFAKMKKNANNTGKRMSRDTFTKMNAALDKRIDFNNNMKKILSPEQYAKFKKATKNMKKRISNRRSKMRKRR